MKSIKYIILLLISFILFDINVYADNCFYKEQITLNNDLSNIKITYEIINDNKVNILIYNITQNVYITYNEFDTKEEIDIHYYDTDNGKLTIERNGNNVEEYSFQIKSNLSACYGNILSTKKIVKPKYNNYHTLEICEEPELKNHSYCQEYITTEITKSESEVIKTLNEYLNNKVKKITTTQVVEPDKVTLEQKVIYSSITFVIIAAIIVSVIIIKKKRSEL